MNRHYEFSLMELPYSYSSLEPYLTEEVVKTHHLHHHQAYVNKLNEVLAPYPQYHSWTLEQLVTCCSRMPAALATKVRNNAGGVCNHNLYFLSMGPPRDEKDKTSQLYLAIEKVFGAFDNFASLFKKNAVNILGSGYCWLAWDPRIKGGPGLRIITTPNQNSVLSLGLFPIFGVDMWEHAYYLQYEYRRADYLENWFSLINWERANSIFVSYQSRYIKK